MQDDLVKVEKYAFVKGMRELQARDRLEAQLCRREISNVLKEGGITARAFWLRMTGCVAHTPAEVAAIAKIFKKYGVSDPWGLA